MFTFDIRPDNASEFRVVATSRDVSLWERTFKGRSLRQIEERYSMSLMEEIAFTACRRQHRWDGSLSEFCDQVDIDIIDTRDNEEGDDAGTGLDPTRSDR